jgi:predicted ABC-type ATPase
LKPVLYIITDSNGAGKSSIGPEYLPEFVRNNFSVFDGDLLFNQKRKELFPFHTKSPKEASKIAYQYVSNLFDELVEEAISTNSNFVYEGHFTNNATWDIPKKFKEKGYKLNLLFLGLSDPDLSQLRVTDRVSEGGHYVDRLTIEANFSGNLEKLNKYYTLFDNIQIIDTSDLNHILIASITFGIKEFAIPHKSLPWWCLKFMPQISEILK